MNRLGTSDLRVFPLCLGGNVFGWTADEPTSFAVLDAYVAVGGNFIDTADTYASWLPGSRGGESETILGRWMRARKNRDQLVIATKVGKAPGLMGLSPETIRKAVDASLARLGIEHIDLYYAHQDDLDTPQVDTLRALDALVRAGKVRHLAASNYSAERLSSALAISRREGLASFVALQPHYNVVHRAEYENELRPVVEREGLACAPYFALARGFLTGKYRPGVHVDSPRAKGAAEYATERGLRTLAAIEEVASAHHTTIAAVALAALLAQPTIAAPIASARTTAQLAELLPMATLQLTSEELARIDAASAGS